MLCNFIIYIYFMYLSLFSYLHVHKSIYNTMIPLNYIPGLNTSYAMPLSGIS